MYNMGTAVHFKMDKHEQILVPKILLKLNSL